MRNPDGQVTVVGDLRPGDTTVGDLINGVRHVEQTIDTFQCGHCQRIVHVLPRQDPAQIGGGCYICKRNICSHCVDKGTCDPWEEKIARLEAKMEARRHYPGR